MIPGATTYRGPLGPSGVIATSMFCFRARVHSRSAWAPRRLDEPRIGVTPKCSNVRASSPPSLLALIKAANCASGRLSRRQFQNVMATASRLCQIAKITGWFHCDLLKPVSSRRLARHDLDRLVPISHKADAASRPCHFGCCGTTTPPLCGGLFEMVGSALTRSSGRGAASHTPPRGDHHLRKARLS